MNCYLYPFSLFLLFFLLLGHKIPVLAQSSSSNPLEIIIPDPLLPKLTENRSLNTLERFQLQSACDELNKQATEQYQGGNVDKAFEFWYRELRLRRALSSLEEVQALARVGKIAWDNNRKADIQIITQRLNVIKTEEREILMALAEAYNAIGNPTSALAVYQEILELARQEQDLVKQKQILTTMSSIHLAKFNYPEAAKVYEELLNIARTEKDYLNEVTYLQKLADLYNQAILPENALNIKQELIEKYENDGDKINLAKLKLSLGLDYQALNQPENAKINYQESFQLAWSEQQFGVASEALQKLADLYNNYEEKTAALGVYQQLIDLQKKFYDFYGLMNTYASIGQIHLAQNNYNLALKSFQEGLEIANSLQYRQDYFNQEIEKLQKQETPTN